MGKGECRTLTRYLGGRGMGGGGGGGGGTRYLGYGVGGVGGLQAGLANHRLKAQQSLVVTM